MSKRRIYPLVGYSPEVVAVAFGKCSRSPEPFDKIAQELDTDKSRRFHEKWIVGYGHSSVAEHAILSLAFENVSILATKVIEDNRLASYTEKSTRYQKFDKEHYYKPSKLMKSNLGKLYKEICDFYFDTYDKIVPKMHDFLQKKYPKDKETEEKIYQTKIKNKVFDNCRYMLPIATQTNLGMTVNARELAYAIVKLLSHPLEEIQQIGKEVKKTALKIVPTLIKYADYNEYIYQTAKSLSKLSKKYLKKSATAYATADKPVVLVKYDKDAEERLLTALLYKFSTLPYFKIQSVIKKMNQRDKEKIIDESLNKMERHDHPPREFEHTYYTFDILMDYGAFRDIQRHRICTQTNQYITTKHGYSTPEEIIEAGFSQDYDNLMEKAALAFDKISKRFPLAAQYLVPLAYKKRTLITWNLRELYHFIKLRSGPTGHLSYRKIAQEVYKEVKKVHPLLSRYIMVNLE